MTDTVWVKCRADVAQDLVTLGRVGAADVQSTAPNIAPPPAVPPPVPLPPAPPADPAYFEPPWFRQLRYAHLRSRGAMLFGPRGSGKTRAIAHLCKSEGVEAHGLTAFDGIGEEHLVGSMSLVNDGGASVTRFQPGPLARALADDCVFYLEEADRARPSLLSMLNTLTDGSGLPLALPDGSRLLPGPGFRVYLTWNPGAQYGGRGMNQALRDRLVPVLADYPPPDVERAILRSIVPALEPARADQLIDVAHAIRAGSDAHGFDCSVRALSQWADMALSGVCADWRRAYDIAVIDRAGSPADDGGLRDLLAKVADDKGVASWT
jgi:MoxR-like ATPase